jgi:hypothetical protein
MLRQPDWPASYLATGTAEQSPSNPIDTPGQAEENKALKSQVKELESKLRTMKRRNNKLKNKGGAK